jgi:hypothetical protein
MSRSDYVDDMDDQWAHIRWRGAVASAIRGKRGQALLSEMLAAMDALPEKKLVSSALEAEGQYCALGTVGAKRGLDMKAIDPEDYTTVARAFDIAEPLAREVAFMNDEAAYYNETPEQRFERMRRWVSSLIAVPKS